MVFEEALSQLFQGYKNEKSQNEEIQKDNLELLEKVTKHQEVIDLLQEQLEQVLEQNRLLKAHNKGPDRERLQLLKENELLQETIDSIQDNNRQLDKIIRENRQLKEQKNRMQRMLNELSKKENEMCLCQVRKAQLESKYSKSVQRPRRGYENLKTPVRSNRAIKEPEDEEVTKSPRFNEINSESYHSPKKQDKIVIKKLIPFDMTKSLFSTDTYKTVATQQSLQNKNIIKFKKIMNIKTPKKVPEI